MLVIYYSVVLVVLRLRLIFAFFRSNVLTSRGENCEKTDSEIGCCSDRCPVHFWWRVHATNTSLGWKLQRITGGFLLIMVPAHMLFMHLNPGTAHEASVVIARMQNVFIKIVDIGIVISVLIHGGYGLLSIAKDYIASKFAQNLCAFLISAVMVLFAWVGIKLTVLI